MTNLNVTLLNDAATMPNMIGAAVQLPVLNSFIDVIQRPGEKVAQAYWIHTGIAFDVPDGHILKIYPAPELAQQHLARLAECVAVVLPGDNSEVKLRLVVDNGGKAFEPKAGMVVAYALLEAAITPVLVGVEKQDKTVVPASENNEPEKSDQRTKKAK